MKISPSTIITSATLINLDNNFNFRLFERQGSRCHFCKELEFQDYIIHLRLDWKDIVNNAPVLDVDIWRKPKNKKNRLKTGRWHHVSKYFSQKHNRNVYSFEFMNLKLELGAEIGVAKIFTTDLRMRLSE